MSELKDAMDALERLRRRSNDTVKIHCARIQAELIELQELINKIGESANA